MEITVKLYEQDPYCTEFSSMVLQCVCEKGKYLAALKQSAFYPEGGGQPADKGILGGKRVQDVQEKDGIIWHTVSEPLTEGEEVTGKIDWKARFSNMQNHTGEHVVSGMICSRFGYQNVGFHMGSEAVTMDFNGPMTVEEMREIEAAANAAIEADIPVEVLHPSKEELETLDYRSKKEIAGQMRIVRIAGCDICACCGTHVKTTGEVRMIKLLSIQNYKGGVRISMLGGNRALEDYNRKHDIITGLVHLVSVKPEKVEAAVEKLLEENRELRFKIGQEKRQIADLTARLVSQGTEKYCLADEQLEPADLREMANALQSRAETVLVLGKNHSYVLKSGKEDVRELNKKLLEQFSGRGGGSAEMVQGTLQGSLEKIKQFFEQF